MQKNLLRILAGLFFVCSGLTAAGQAFTATYDFAAVTQTSGATDPTPVPTATGVTFGSFSAAGVSANSTGAGRFSFSNWSPGAANGSNVFTGGLDFTDYYSVTLSPQSGYSIDISSIAFTLQRSGTGVRQFVVRSSQDNFGSNLPVIVPSNPDLSVLPDNTVQIGDVNLAATNGLSVALNATSITGAVTLRFYAFNTEASGGTFSIDNVVFSGIANPPGTSLTVSTTSLSFGATPINTDATPQSYTITGAGLTDPVELATAAPYYISENVGGPFTTTLSIPAANVASPKTIYVRFSPTVAGTPAGTITHNSTGAAERIVNLSGEATDPAAATVSVTPAVLNFPATGTGSNSASLSYTLTANNLSSDVTITAAAPFSISADNISFSNALAIPATDPTLATGKTIYVRFSPTVAGNASTGITNAATGATTQTVTVNGSAIGLINLTAPPYNQDFNSIASGLPVGFSVRTGSTSSSFGTAATFTTTPATWANSGAGFKNYASGNIDEGGQQGSATDRAIGIRQTGSVGDPGAAFVAQIANTLGKINFTLDFKLQSLDAASARSVVWQVQYGIGAAPTTWVVPTTTGNLATGGQSFSNNDIHVDFGNALDNLSDIITIRIVTLNASTGSGSRPSTAIDDFELGWEDPSAKTISLSTAALAFPATATGSSSTLNYTIVNQTNLDQPVLINATAPYTLSEDNITFTSSLSIPAASAIGKIIYVKFSPVTVGVYNSQVTNASTGANTKTINVSGEGIDANALSFNFNSCTVSSIPGSGFLSINVTGAQKWGCSQFGNNSTNAISVNGFSGSAQTNDAWLISPALNLSNIVNLPVLSFYSRGEFSGPKLQLYVSTTYDGSSVPNLADWTELDGFFPTPPGAATTNWTYSDNISLEPYKSAPQVYIAFRYTSSAALNAARWSVDDIMISDQTALLTLSPLALNFGEVSVGSSSAGQAVNVKAQTPTDLTITPPAGYELSADNVTYSSAPLVITQASATAGVDIYVRFTPQTKALRISGALNVATPGTNKNIVSLTGTSYPKSETLDIAAYNISFFGSNSNNNSTPAEVAVQVNNITTVMQRLNMDAIAIEEMSNDAALAQLIGNLPGYAAVVSPRWSYSFDAPDPDFPPQKIGFIYNTATMTLSATEPPRVMFESMYDSARLGLPNHRLGDYPTGTPSSFWASGRLPYMATFTTNVNGQFQTVRLIVLHGKSGGNQGDYVRRAYDNKVLKDTLDALYPNDNVIILGDYNDRLVTSIAAGNPSSYQPFVADNANWNSLTLPLDQAGRTSFPSSNGLIDHIIVSNELSDEYILTSADIEDPRTYIAVYTATTASDHLPVYARFTFEGSTLPVTLSDFNATPAGNKVKVTWSTETEAGNSHFDVQRSSNGSTFATIGQVAGAGNANTLINYQFIDSFPVNGNNYYRLRQVDADGRATYSDIVLVRFGADVINRLLIYPNPVRNNITLNLNGSTAKFRLRVTDMSGRVAITGNGTISQLNVLLNDKIGKLGKGNYVLQLSNDEEEHRVKFSKQ